MYAMKLLHAIALLMLGVSAPLLAQVPCDAISYFNASGQDYIHTMNLPTVWWGVRITPEPFDAEVDSAYIGFGIEKNTSQFLYDSLEVRVLRDTLPLIQVLDVYKSAIPAGLGGTIPDNYWVVELDFDQVAAKLPPGKSFWLTWRLVGPAADVGRTIMKLDAANKTRSIVMNANGTYQTVTQYLTNASFRDSVDLWAEARVCYYNGKPVELSAFSATYENGRGLLEWTTSSETNNFGFDIERVVDRSDDGAMSIWGKIAFVNGNGSTNTEHKYRFVDENPRAAMDGRGIVRYRLKQIDFDGGVNASPVAELRVPFSAGGMELHQNYPNPFTRSMISTTLSFSLEQPGTVEVDLYDMLGRHARSLAQGEFAAGSHDLRIEAAGLVPGSYIAVLRSADERLVRRISLLD